HARAGHDDVRARGRGVDAAVGSRGGRRCRARALCRGRRSDGRPRDRRRRALGRARTGARRVRLGLTHTVRRGIVPASGRTRPVPKDSEWYMRRMLKPALVTFVVVASLLALALPAVAITGGTEDTANTYSNVGVLVFYQPDGRFRCTATLIAPRVLLT